MPADRHRRRGAARRGAQAARDLQLCGRDRQRRPRGGDAARHPRRQHARRAHRRDRRPRLRTLARAARRLPEGERDVREGQWVTLEPRPQPRRRGERRDARNRRLRAHRPGRRPRAPRASAWSPPHRRHALEALLERADFVCLHCPLTPETRHLIDRDALARDEAHRDPREHRARPDRRPAALARALYERAIGGAALDVTDPEPLPADHPLLQAPNLLVVPHVGSATVRTRHKMTELAVDNLLAALAGEPMPHRGQLTPASRSSTSGRTRPAC